MEKEKLILIRNFLFKTFIVGIVFAAILFVLTMCFWDTAAGFMMAKLTVQRKVFGKAVLDFFSNVRFYLIFIILVPALALHWLIKSTKD